MDVQVYRGNKENHTTLFFLNLNLWFSRVSVNIHDVVSTPRILKSRNFVCFQTDENRLVLFSSCNDQYDMVLKQTLNVTQIRNFVFNCVITKYTEP